MFAQEATRLTPAEYLKAEEQSTVKHEYRDGHAYAMAGANDTHFTISGNLYASLRNHLRDTLSRVYLVDMKVELLNGKQYYYPDVMVTCDARDTENSSYKQFPKLIVEVLSESTEAFDRGDKFADYQALKSLQEYVLINSKRQRVECFRRTEKNLWLLQSYTAESGHFQLTSVGFDHAIAALYKNVSFTADPLMQ